MIIPRLFWVAAGAAGGLLAVQRARRAARAVTPAGLADRAGASAQGAQESVASWWSTVRILAADREAELREALGLDGTGPADELPDTTPKPAPPTGVPARPTVPRRLGKRESA